VRFGFWPMAQSRYFIGRQYLENSSKLTLCPFRRIALLGTINNILRPFRKFLSLFTKQVKDKKEKYVDLYSALDDKYLVLKALRHGSHHACL